MPSAKSTESLIKMGIIGNLTTMSVSDLLQFLPVGRKTGALKFTHGKVAKGIYFEDGFIVGSSTNDPTEYLGQVLIHYGKINEAQLQGAMEVKRKEGGPRLGQILVKQGVLRDDEVVEILKIRTCLRQFSDSAGGENQSNQAGQNPGCDSSPFALLCHLRSFAISFERPAISTGPGPGTSGEADPMLRIE
ncbi:MAG: DUF4388 domain-containing protein [Nitrospiraceae bacterium]|nr:DUF4388 domain-containing protein [Nitrospiraceae bacterium]